MKNLLSLLLTFLSFVGFSQTEPLAEPNFQKYPDSLVAAYSDSIPDKDDSPYTLRQEDFNQGLLDHPLFAIQGRIPGVSVNRIGSNPFETPILRSNGISAWQANSTPYIVVDGVPGLSLEQVVPEDIQEIRFEPFAAGAGIYGANSNSGVLFIKTQRGAVDVSEGNKSLWRVKLRTGVRTDDLADRLPLADTEKFLELNPNNDNGSSTDWLSEVTRNSLSFSNDLNIQFSGKRGLDFSLTGSRRSLQGLGKNTLGANNYLRLRFNQSLFADKLQVFMNAFFTHRRNNQDLLKTFAATNRYNPSSPIWTDRAAGIYFYEPIFLTPQPVSYQNNSLFETQFSSQVLSGGVSYKPTAFFEISALYYRQSRLFDEGVFYNKNNLYHDADVLNGLAEIGSALDENSGLRYTTRFNLLRKRKAKLSLNIGAWGERTGRNKSEKRLRNFVDNVSRIDFSNIDNEGEIIEESDREFESATLGLFSSIDLKLLRGLYFQSGFMYHLSEGRRNIALEANRPFTEKTAAYSASLYYNLPKNSVNKGDNWSIVLAYGQTLAQPDKVFEVPIFIIFNSRNHSLDKERKREINFGLHRSKFFFDKKLELNLQAMVYANTIDRLFAVIPLSSPPFSTTSRPVTARDLRLHNRGIQTSINLQLKKGNFVWRMNANISRQFIKTGRKENDNLHNFFGEPGISYIPGTDQIGGADTPVHFIDAGEDFGILLGMPVAGQEGDQRVYSDSEGNISTYLNFSQRSRMGVGTPKYLMGLQSDLTFNGKWNVGFGLRAETGHTIYNNSRGTGERYTGNSGFNHTITTYSNFTVRETDPGSGSLFEKGDYLACDYIRLAYTVKSEKLFKQLQIGLVLQNPFWLYSYTGQDPSPRYFRIREQLYSPVQHEQTREYHIPGQDSHLFYPRARSISFSLEAKF